MTRNQRDDCILERDHLNRICYSPLKYHHSGTRYSLGFRKRFEVIRGWGGRIGWPQHASTVFIFHQPRGQWVPFVKLN